jgi:hypothetical protein
MPGTLKRDTMHEAVLAELVQHAQQQLLLARRAGVQAPVRAGGGDVFVREHRDANGHDVRAYTRRRGGI